MSSFDRNAAGTGCAPALYLLMMPFLAFFSPLAAQSPARLAAASGTIPPRLAARVAETVARGWGADTSGMVLSWGSGSLAGVPDTCAFQLFGQGDGGWFAVSFEPPHGTPVAIRLRVGLTRTRLVAGRNLRPGMRLVEGDFRAEPHLFWGPPDEAAEPPASLGWVVKRPIAAGAPLDRVRVVPPPVVTAGQPVKVLWAKGNVSVALAGTALNDAVVGETVRVRTGRRTGVLLGIVTAPGEARMQ